MKRIFLLFVSAQAFNLSGAIAQSRTLYRHFTVRPFPARFESFIDPNYKTPANYPTIIRDKIKKESSDLVTSALPLDKSNDLYTLVWAYLTADGDPALRGSPQTALKMKEWIDKFLASFRNPTTTNTNFSEGNWFNDFDSYAFALIEITKNPTLSSLIGVNRIALFREKLIVLATDYLEGRNLCSPAGTLECFKGLLDENGTDPVLIPDVYSFRMGAVLSGWLLTGKSKFLKAAQYIVYLFDQSIIPGGAADVSGGIYHFYRDPGWKESTPMQGQYQYAVTAALYKYWWLTKDPVALNALQKLGDYIKINVPFLSYIGDEGLHGLSFDSFFDFNKGLWFHTATSAMAALIAGAAAHHGQPSAAYPYAFEGINEVDLYSPPLAWHALYLIAKRTGKAVPARPKWFRSEMIEDHSIKGHRNFEGKWASVYATTPFSPSRASAIAVLRNPNLLYANQPETVGTGYVAFTRANTYHRTYKLFDANIGQWIVGGAGPGEGGDSWVMAPGAIRQQLHPAKTYVSAVQYRNYAAIDNICNGRASLDPACLSNWQSSEIWITLRDRMIGVISSNALAPVPALGFEHIFRFNRDVRSDHLDSKKHFVPGPSSREWSIEDMGFKIWDENFCLEIVEKARASVLATFPSDVHAVQIALTDLLRYPYERIFAKADPAHDRYDQPTTTDLGPAPQCRAGRAGINLNAAEITYPAGQNYYSVVEVFHKPGRVGSPSARVEFSRVGPLLKLSVDSKKVAYYNPSPNSYRLPIGEFVNAVEALASWRLGSQPLSRSPIPPNGLMWIKKR